MSQVKTFVTPALVLKRTNVGEADRIVTLFTRDQGKVVAIAKGVRQLKSARRAYLEPGNLVKAFFVVTKSLPILSQAELLNTHSYFRNDLHKLRQLSQLLEMIDTLFVENLAEEILFEEVTELLNACDALQEQSARPLIRRSLIKIITQLGYPPPSDNHAGSLSEYIAEITDKPLRSWEFLKVD